MRLASISALAGVAALCAGPALAQRPPPRTAPPAPAAQPPTTGVLPGVQAGDEQALHALAQAISRDWSSGDAQAFAAHFLDDARLTNPAGRTAQGAQGIRQLYEDEHGAPGPMADARMQSSIERIRWVSPTAAWVDVAQTITGPRVPPHARASKVTALVVRTDQGWKVAEARVYAATPPRPLGRAMPR